MIFVSYPWHLNSLLANLPVLGFLCWEREELGRLQNTLSHILPEEQLSKFNDQYLVLEKENEIQIVVFPSICSQLRHTGEWGLGQKPSFPSKSISSDLTVFEQALQRQKGHSTHSGASSYRSLTTTKNLCVLCPSSGYRRPRGVQCNAGAVHEDWRWFPYRLLSDRQGQLRARGQVPPADPQSQGQVSVTSPGTADHPGAWLHISPQLLPSGWPERKPYVGFVDLSVVNKKWFTSSDEDEALSMWKGSVVL